MLRKCFVLAGILAVVCMCSPVLAGDCKGCAAVKERGEGFCSGCGKGIAFGAEHTSKKLADALAGQEIKADEVKCPGCKAVAKEGGVCDHCKVGIAHGKAYHSMLAYKLAKGTLLQPDQTPKCAGCTKAIADDGFCTTCGVGYVAHYMYKGKADYDAAVAAHEVLARATKAIGQCEACAVAMVTDGTCATCKVSFKDGQKVGT